MCYVKIVLPVLVHPIRAVSLIASTFLTNRNDKFFIGIKYQQKGFLLCGGVLFISFVIIAKPYAFYPSSLASKQIFGAVSE